VTTPAAAAHAAEPVPREAPPIADQAGAALREEMLPLFLVEASEWLDQIATALHEWEGASAGPRAEVLRRTIRAAVTNLGGSAATIGLTAIERLAFALLSELEGPGPHGSAPHETFAQIDVALRALAAAPGPEPARGAAELHHLAAALRELEESRAQASPRILEGLRALSAQLRCPGDQGGPVVDGKAIRQWLEELAALDERVLTETRDGLPEIGRLLALLTAGTGDSGTVEAILRTASRMRWTAQEAGADSYVRLLDGLETFLIISKGHRGSVSPDRFTAVTDQLGQALPTVTQWMAAGRTRRAAVEQALSVPPPSIKRSRKSIVPV
jgi:hypothetical protein